jgi:N,N'-diacetyllegionaminate synthase
MTPHGIRIGDRMIGDGARCFIAAEIGINHGGDLDLARAMIDAAARAGACGVKFQNYRTDDFISDRSLTYSYQRDGETHTVSQYDLFRSCELNAASLRVLAAHCRAVGVEFFSTPTGEDGLADLIAAGGALVKNGSDYLTHLPLIAAMARSGLPTVLSTGMATLTDVDDAVHAFRAAGGRDLLLLHCTSAYPTPDADANLRRIPALATRYGCPAGFSDHTWGAAAASAAVALGAVFIEKHFTIDRTLPGPDQAFSSDEAELRELVTSVRRTEALLGSAVIGPAPSEAAGRAAFRLSCVAREPLPAGHRIGAADIAFRRPGDGLEPRHATDLIGRSIIRPLSRGDRFHLEDLA